MQILNNIEEVVEAYHILIIDLWGVIHDGSKLYPKALDFLKKLQKKKVYFLSNAPRRATKVISVLNDLGIDKSLYKFVVSSGEVFYQSLTVKSDIGMKTLDENYYYIGPDKDKDIINDLPYKVVNEPKKASFAIVAGVDADYPLDEYKLILENCLKAKLPLFCINPDRYVVKQNTKDKSLCAGVLASLYEEIGGKVYYYGKPYANVYNYLLAQEISYKKNTILAIGDSMEHDINGANNFGVDSVLVAGGIHKNDIMINGRIDKDKLKLSLSKYGAHPTFVVSGL